MAAVKSFQPLLEKASTYATSKHDTLERTAHLSFTEDGRLSLPSDYGNMSLGMEENALNQLSDRLGRTFWGTGYRVIPSEFYRTMHSRWPSQFAQFSNELLENANAKFLIRGYGDDVRAVLSDQYATLDNLELLEMASEVLDGLDYEIVESGKYYARNDGVQRDEMHVRVVVKKAKPEDEGPYGLGIMIRNGETGGAASEIRPLVMRTSCMNSLVFKVGENNERAGLRLHHKGSKDAKAVLLASAIGEALPMAEAGLEKFLLSKRKTINLKGIIAKLGEEQGWSEEMKITVATGSEGHQSVFGLVNGLTFAAHEMDVDASTRFSMETMASEYVYNPDVLVRASQRLEVEALR